MTGEISLRGAGAAGRRHQGENHRGGARGHSNGDPAGAQPARPRGHSGKRPQPLQFVWAERIEDVLARALEDAPVRRAAA